MPKKAEMTGEVVDAATLPADAHSFMDDEFEPRPREVIYVDRSGCLVERRPLPELPPEAEPRKKAYPPPACLTVLCRCGAPYRMHHGGHSTLGPHPCVPAPPADPPPKPVSAHKPVPTVRPRTAPKDAGPVQEPPENVEVPAPKPRLVRSTGSEPAKPTGEPERTNDPDGWLS